MSVNNINSKIVNDSNIRTSKDDEIRFKSAEANALSTSFATALLKNIDMTQNKVVENVTNDNAQTQIDIKLSSSEMADLIATMRRN